MNSPSFNTGLPSAPSWKAGGRKFPPSSSTGLPSNFAAEASCTRGIFG
ncbi:MAG TPA: hypothetical protein VH500_17665 [Nitrososphaeraceae archaeon]